MRELTQNELNSITGGDREDDIFITTVGGGLVGSLFGGPVGGALGTIAGH